MKILISGAAGKTGQAVIQACRPRGVSIRALVRREAQIESVKALGASDVVVGDMTDTAVWQQASQGMQGLYYICPNMHPHETTIAQLAIKAAKANMVQHVVYHSVLHPQTEEMPHHWHKLRVEEMLFASGLDITIVQPAAYMQNMLGQWQTISQKGIYRVPYPVETRLSLVDLADVAEAAAIILTEPGHKGAVYELVGVEPLTQTQIAQILSDVLERPVTAVEQPLSAWQEAAEVANLNPYAVETLLKMFTYYARYGFRGNRNVLRWLLKREPTTLRQFVSRSHQ